jgi:hypothetical protein
MKDEKLICFPTLNLILIISNKSKSYSWGNESKLHGYPNCFLPKYDSLDLVTHEVMSSYSYMKHVV